MRNVQRSAMRSGLVQRSIASHWSAPISQKRSASGQVRAKWSAVCQE
ncbi:MAG: hypothetical protein R3F11_04430 [Verrucomicrobiales bacterium]